MTALKGRASLYQKNKLAQLEACKEHDGPFTKPDDIRNFLVRCTAGNKSSAYVKKALKAEVSFARENYTKRPKSDDVFRIRDRTTNKDLTPDQYANNLTTLFSNILSVAEVPFPLVRGALEKALSTAGLDFVTSECSEVAAAPSEASREESPSVANPSNLTCSVDSPAPIHVNRKDYFIGDYVSIAVSSEEGKTWQLGMIDDFPDSKIARISFFIPVPGRMGDKRVAFFPPVEDEEKDIPTNAFLPLSPKIDGVTMDGRDVYVVSNHEQLDAVLMEVQT